jgi:hypothetical protein
MEGTRLVERPRVDLPAGEVNDWGIHGLHLTHTHFYSDWVADSSVRSPVERTGASSALCTTHSGLCAVSGEAAALEIARSAADLNRNSAQLHGDDLQSSDGRCSITLGGRCTTASVRWDASVQFIANPAARELGSRSLTTRHLHGHVAGRTHRDLRWRIRAIELMLCRAQAATGG